MSAEPSRLLTRRRFVAGMGAFGTCAILGVSAATGWPSGLREPRSRSRFRVAYLAARSYGCVVDANWQITHGVAVKTSLEARLTLFPNHL